MRGVVIAASLALPLAMCATGHAADTPRPDPEFRLLVLDGSPVRWALPQGRERTIVTYAFLKEPTEFKGARNCSRMRPPAAALERSNVNQSAFRHEVRAAFDMWQAAANIEFREMDKVAEAGILIGAEAEPRGRAFTNVTPRGSAGVGVSGISQSLICLNPETRWKIGFDGNLEVYDLRYTMAHEIGHAIGLDHPGAEGQLMSYRYVERVRGLRPGDAAGAAQLYGLPMPTDATVARDSAPRLPQNAAATSKSGGARFGLGETEALPAKPTR